MNTRQKFIYILLMLIAIITLLPFAYQIIMSLSTTNDFPTSISELTLDNYRFFLQDAQIFIKQLNTLIIATLSLIGSVLFASLAAFALTRITSKWAPLISGLIFLGLFMPGQVLIVPVYDMFVQLGLLNTRIGLILYYVGSAMPFAVFFLSVNFKSMPNSLVESAFVDGASWFTIYSKIAVPYVKPAIITLSFMNFIFFWNELFYALITLTDPSKQTITAYTSTMAIVYENNLPMLFAGLFLAAIPSFIFYVFFQRKIMKGENAGALK